MKKVFKLFTLMGIIGVISFLYFYFNYQFWTYVKTDNFNSLVEYNGQNIKGLFGRQILVNKDFKNDLDQIDKYAISHDIVLIINQSYRSEEETINRKTVRPAKQSNHLAGFAIDFNIESNGVKYYANDLKRNTSLVLILRILERVGNLKLDFIQYKNLLDLSFNKLKDVVVAPTVVKIIYSKFNLFIFLINYFFQIVY